MQPHEMLTLQPAGRWRRFACMLYEGVLLFGVVFLADYLLDTLTQSTHALMWRHMRQAWLFVAIGLYFVISWRYGQTLPMKTWHLRLIDAQGRVPSLALRVVRYTLAWIPVLLAAGLVWLLYNLSGLPAMNLLIVFAPLAGFVYSWFSPNGLFLHDHLLGTRIVSLR